MSAENLSLETPIGITSEGHPVKATQYLESIIFEIIAALGGEGTTEIDVMDGHSEVPAVLAKLTRIDRRVEALELVTPNKTPYRDLIQKIDDLEMSQAKYLTKIKQLERRVDDLEVAGANLVKLTTIYNRLDELEATMPSVRNLARINQRIDDLECT